MQISVFVNFALLLISVSSARGSSECRPDEYRCKNNLCIPKSSVCDGLLDCHDDDDEEDCDDVHKEICKDGEKCETVSECIKPEWRCDGRPDCSDSSDETYCGGRRNGKACADGEIACKMDPLLCIPRSWQCDGTVQCADASDEVGCKRLCNGTDFRCANSLCISGAWKCDGMNDCKDGSDEIDCGTDRVQCKEHEYQCRSGDMCVLLTTDVCNGHDDCQDGSDEGGLCADSDVCNQSRHNCSQICILSPRGAICRCSEGYRLASDNVTCLHPDPCQEQGNKICQQTCLNDGDEFKCLCIDGYMLNHDGKTCSVTGKSPLLLIASDTVISSFNMSAKERSVIKRNLRNVYDIAYDDDTQTVYWIDIRSKSIHSISLHNSVSKTIISFGLIHPEGIHVDWISHKLYVIDSGRQEILACPLNGHLCAVIVNDLDKPSAIVTDPVNRVMYWSDAGHSAHIKSSSMDGEGQKVIVQNGREGRVMKWPNALFVDYVSKRLYWLDIRVKSVQSVKFDGSDYLAVLQNSVGQYPFSLVILQGRVIWSDSHRNTILSADVKSGKQRYDLMKNVRRPTGLVVSHPSMQPAGENLCPEDVCDLCVLSRDSAYKCLCPVGSVIAENGNACVVISGCEAVVYVGYYVHSNSREKEPEQDFLVFSQPLDLMQVRLGHVGSRAVMTIEKPKWEKLFALAAVPGSDRLVYSDIARDIIASTRLDRGHQQETVIASGDMGTVTKIILDDIMQYIYWTDLQKNTLEVSRMDGKFRTTLLSGRDSGMPYALALCRKYRYLIYTDIGQSPRVQRCHLDAKNCTTLTSKIGKIYEIAIDEKTCDIYALMKMFKYSLGRITIDGHSLVVLVRNLHDPVALVILRGFVYWLDGNNLYTYDTESGKTQKFFLEDATQVLSGTVFDVDKKSRHLPYVDDCLEENSRPRCSQLCFSKPKGGYSCGCQTGMFLSRDNSSCVSQLECGAGEFTCDSRNQCILKSLVCDGKMQCRDMSDEKYCGAVSSNYVHRCGKREFMCRSEKICIDERQRCDGQAQCSDSSDEADCCSNKQFRCSSDGSCIKKSKVCDQFRDCSDGSDENRPECGLCSDGKFRCSNRLCIDLDLVCNGNNDCSDASDEGLQCRVSCEEKKCAQNCTQTPMGPICGCGRGYTLASSGTMCNDVDECSQLRPVCSQTCLNNVGSFTCQCVHGFRLHTDGQSCKLTSKEPPITLFYGTRGKILSLILSDKSDPPTQPPTKPKLLTKIKGTAIAIDYNYRKNILYWTSISGEIMMMKMTEKKAVRIAESITDPYGIAVDWTTGNLYIINRHKCQLYICSDNGDMCRIIMTSSQESQLQCVAVHPARRLVFVTTSNTIRRITVDGYHSEVIAYDHSMPTNGLSIDYNTDRLYWTNRMKSIVETANLDGSNRHALADDLRRPFSVDVLGDVVVISDWRNNLIATKSSFRLSPKVVIQSRLDHVLAVKIWHPLKQPNYENLCEGSPCSHLCVPTQKSYVCLCPDGLDILYHNATCRNCSEFCPSGQTCVQHDADHVRCVCIDRDCGYKLVPIPSPVAEPGANDGGSNYGWVAAVVIGVIILVILLGLLVVYAKRKQKTLDLMGMIRYRNPIFHPKTEECDELVTDLSFRNPGFEEHDINSNKVMKNIASSDTSESSTDSAFYSPNNRTKVIPTPGSYKNFGSEYEY